MAVTESPITPAVIGWALDEDGRDIHAIADEMAVPVEVLVTWRSGAQRPSRGQVTRLAEVLRRPRAMFFLPKPPRSAALPTTFRHPAGNERQEISASARRWIRDARRVQRLIAWLAQEMGGEPSNLPVESYRSDPESSARRIREWLDLSYEKQLSWRDSYEALRGWRRAVERRGILVFQYAIGQGDIRGLSAWNSYTPLIALNSSGQRPHPRAFSLGHELGHLVRRADAACLDWIAPAEASKDRPLERWCERFAAALLLPADLVLEVIANVGDTKDELELVRRVARRTNVSLRATALRLIELKIASADAYRKVEAAAVPRPTSSDGGGSDRRAVVRLRQYGPQVAVRFEDAVATGRLTPRDAVVALRVPFSDFRELTAVAREELERQ